MLEVVVRVRANFQLYLAFRADDFFELRSFRKLLRRLLDALELLVIPHHQEVLEVPIVAQDSGVQNVVEEFLSFAQLLPAGISASCPSRRLKTGACEFCWRWAGRNPQGRAL